MKEKHSAVYLSPLPQREELENLPRAPRIVIDISRQMRYHMKHGNGTDIMSQHTARLLFVHLMALGTCSQLELAASTHLSPASVSILLRRLEEGGYIERHPFATDHRVLMVGPTQKGIQFDREHLEKIIRHERKAMEGFTAEEEKTLEELLLRMYQNLLKDGE